MTIKISSGCANGMAREVPLKDMISGGVIRYFTGSQPTDADTPMAGTQLCQFTVASGTYTAEVLSFGLVSLDSGTEGSVDAITVDSVEVLGAVVPYNTSLTQTAVDVVSQINRHISNPNYSATSATGVITIQAHPGTGTSPNGFVVASTVTTLSKTDTNMTGGVASANGLSWEAGSTAGTIIKRSTETWSGVASATGTVGCARITGSIADANGTSTTLVRVDMSVGTTTASDLVLGVTTINSGDVESIASGTLTMPKA